MISIVIASKNKDDLERCQRSIAETIGVEYEVLVTENSKGMIPLTKVYNDGARNAMYGVVCFVHEDVEFKKQGWGRALLRLLADTRVGVVGVVGSTYFPENGAWASPGVPFIKGRIIHVSPQVDLDQIDLFSEELGDVDVVTVDGVFMGTRKDVVEEVGFDEATFDGFHFYDADFCVRVAQQYRVVVTTGILLKHYSHGTHDEAWNLYKERFIEKHKALLPFTNQEKKPHWKDIKTWQVKYLLYKKDGSLRP